MGRSQITKKYEITDEIRELQKLAIDAQKSSGCEVNIDITQDLVTINGFRKMNREQAKSYLLQILNPDNPDRKITKSTVPDPEKEARIAKEEAKKAKKHREPGAPPELKALIRRAKRIFKKTMIKTNHSGEAKNKAYSYLDRKAANNEDNIKATEVVAAYIEKELN